MWRAARSRALDRRSGQCIVLQPRDPSIGLTAGRLADGGRVGGPLSIHRAWLPVRGDVQVDQKSWRLGLAMALRPHSRPKKQPTIADIVSPPTNSLK